mmetsp:Transcript_767/g.1084  ORF Transcript_767/g.1084 Transcript_767/m.1084 type:complete len:301 (+) Transcript_767:2-904(+)
MGSAVAQSGRWMVSSTVAAAVFLYSAVVGAARELASVLKLIAVCVADAAKSTWDFVSFMSIEVAYSVEYGVRTTLEFFVYALESLFSGVVAASYSTAKFVQSLGDFAATSAVRCVEATCSGITLAVVSTWKGLLWTKNKIPVWADKLVDKTPFLERDEEESVALTPSAQAALYVASLVGSFHPDILMNKCGTSAETGSRSIGKAVSTAVEKVKYRFCSPRALFITGSLARGVQLSSTAAHTFQPSLGIGALANVAAIAANERWLSCVVAGWFASGKTWRLFGARPPTVAVKKDDEKKGWF